MSRILILPVKKTVFSLFNFFLFLMFLASESGARNGFIPSYVGTHGLTGGAGTAFPTDGSNVIINPALIGRLPTHVMVMAGLIFQDQTADTSAAPAGNPIGPQKNLHDNNLISSVGLNYRFNEKWAVGFGMSGGGGLGKFRQPLTNPAIHNPPNGFFDTEAVNNVMIGVPTIAYTPTPSQSYGFGLIIGRSDFRADLMNQQFQQINGRLRSDVAYGLGARIGGLWDISKQFSIGTSVSTPVFFQAHEKYRDLFPSPIHVPSTFLFGVAWHITPNTTFLLDYKEYFYGLDYWLRGGQGWRNQTAIMTGIQHKINDRWTVGVGYNYGAPPIRPEKVFFNTTSIPLDEHNFSGGFRFKFAEGKELILVGFYTPRKTMTDDGSSIPFGRGAKISSRAYGFEAGIKIDF